MPIKELIKAGRFGQGLILIEDPVMVGRYNACLVDMGLAPTALESFLIDRMGWSPEIAAEHGNNYYLSHGPANPLAIIVTPDQAFAPIYFPMHSYDWRLMGEWFTTNWRQVNDITKGSAIWLDIDQEVDHYERPEDLLMVDRVVVRANTPCNIMDDAREQTGLVSRWLSESDVHLDTELIGALEVSVKSLGDLRDQQLTIEDYIYTELHDFYTRAFGGVFVLRSMRDHEPLLFCRDPQEAEGIPVADHAALTPLVDRGYLQTDVHWWQDHLYRFDVIADSFLVDVLEQHHPQIDFSKLKDARRRGYVNAHSDELATYLALKRVQDSLEDGQVPVEVVQAVEPFLLHPSDKLDPRCREVQWQLLTYIQEGRFVPLMYRHQKTAFFEGYTGPWTNVRRTWALMNVQRYYDVASKSSDLEL